MKKIWHHYTKWEEHYAGMWRKVSNVEEEPYFRLAITFTGNAHLYGHYMMRVVDSWRFSCEQNLTDSSLNRRAWLGHAACAFAFRCPEYLVRRAWWELTEQQRIEANQKADEAIAEWERRHESHLYLPETRMSSPDQAAHEILQKT